MNIFNYPIPRLRLTDKLFTPALLIALATALTPTPTLGMNTAIVPYQKQNIGRDKVREYKVRHNLNPYWNPDGIPNNPNYKAWFTSDGKKIAIEERSAPCVTEIWDAKTGKNLYDSLPDSKRIVYTCTQTYSNDTQSLILRGGNYDFNLDIKDLKTGILVQTLHILGKVNSYSFSPDGTQILVANGNGKVKIWELGTSKEEKYWHEQANTSCLNRALKRIKNAKLITTLAAPIAVLGAGFLVAYLQQMNQNN